MSNSKAQKIVNEVQDRLGVSLVSYQNSDLEFLKERLEAFLDLEVDTEELTDPEDIYFEGSGDEEEEALEYDCHE